MTSLESSPKGGETHRRSPVTTDPLLGLLRFWRIPVAALLGAILGFGTSYLFGVTYEAKARVLNRVNNVTFLGNNGSTLSQQGASVEQSGVSRIVGETEGALLDNRAIATTIVHQSRLDEKKDDKGWFATVKGKVAKVFKVTYSYLVHGTYKQLNDFDQAVKDTQDGLSAKQVGNSYVIEVTGRWDTPEKAREITSSATDHLVALAEKMFLADVTSNLENLSQQLLQTGAAQRNAAGELAAFGLANGLSTATLGSTLTPALTLQLSPELQSTYQRLQQDYNTSLATYGQLQIQYQQAQVYAGVKPVELTRLDKAVPSVYPVSPKRWLYMAIGIILGALLGLVLTARNVWRRGETLFPRDDEFPRGPARLARPGVASDAGEAIVETRAHTGGPEAVTAQATP